MTVPAALTGDHRMRPPPFAAGSWNGISERMIVSATASRNLLEVILYTRRHFAGCWLRFRGPRRP